MLSSGDVVELDLGLPAGREAGLRRPAIVVTAQRVLDARPSSVHIVPLTSALRPWHAEVRLEPDAETGLERLSAAQCQHLRAVSTARVDAVRGNAGPAALAEIRAVIALLLDLP